MLRIPLEDSTYRHLFGCKDEITDLFLRKYGCEVEFRGPKIRGYQATTVNPELVYRKVLGGLVVSVWKDDLTRQDADVVVNAANEFLDHIGGLALALAKAGGPVIEKDSKEYVKNNGPLKIGENTVTRSGNLPCKCLLHAVGPMWFDYTAKKCDMELAECIRNVLKYVNKYEDIKSVAIPAVSSGIFGFPLQRCADIIVDTVHKFFSTEVKSHLKEIRLVNNDDLTVQAMKRACERGLGPSDLIGATSALDNQVGAVTRSMASKTRTNGAPSNKTAHGQPSSAPSNKTTHGQPSSAPSNKTAYGQPSSAPNNKTAHGQPSGLRSFPEMTQPITINGLTLYLKYGKIEEQNTRIIVNSVSSNLDLSMGAISNAIYLKAGDGLQQEIRKQRSFNRTMIPTYGYNLSCEFVYHVILPTYSANPDNKLQVLSQTTSQCLQSAHAHKSHSISFPAMGTGNIGLSKEKVAEVMMGTVMNFAGAHQCALDVYFVIHPSDTLTYQAFLDQLNRYRSTGATEERGDSRTDIHDSSSKSGDPESPCLFIHTERNEDAEEVKAWLNSILHPKPVSIQNNLILLFGKKEHNILSSPLFLDVSIEESLSDGTSYITIDGPVEDKVKAVIQVERLLLDVQEAHAVTLEEELLEASVFWSYTDKSRVYKYLAKANCELEKAFVTQTNPSLNSDPFHKICMKNQTAEGKEGVFQLQRRTLSSKNGQKRHCPEDWLSKVVLVDPESQVFQDHVKQFKKDKLTLVKMERIHHNYLSDIFQSKKKTSKGKTCKLYQLVPRQFTRLVCEFGFQRVFSNPKDPKFGQGIYFTDSPRRAVDCFHTPNKEGGIFHIFQAEVLIDSSAEGKRNTPVLLQRTKSDDILDLCDSLVNSHISSSIYVIPDGFRANPLYLFTFKR